MFDFVTHPFPLLADRVREIKEEDTVEQYKCPHFCVIMLNLDIISYRYMNEEFTRKLKLGIYISLAVIIFFFVIIIAKGILIPLALSYLFSTLIYPLVVVLKKSRFQAHWPSC